MKKNSLQLICLIINFQTKNNKNIQQKLILSQNTFSHFIILKFQNITTYLFMLF